MLFLISSIDKGDLVLAVKQLEDLFSLRFFGIRGKIDLSFFLIFDIFKK